MSTHLQKCLPALSWVKKFKEYWGTHMSWAGPEYIASDFVC